MIIIKTRQRSAEKLNYVSNGTILALWRMGMDTFEIAKKLGLFEYQVANELPRLRRPDLRSV